MSVDALHRNALSQLGALDAELLDHGAKQRKAKAAADKAEFDALRSGKDERRS